MAWLDVMKGHFAFCKFFLPTTILILKIPNFVFIHKLIKNKIKNIMYMNVHNTIQKLKEAVCNKIVALPRYQIRRVIDCERQFENVYTCCY